jgi:hypothetical protein
MNNNQHHLIEVVFVDSAAHADSTMHNGGLQLRRAISIQAEGTRLLEKHAIAPSAARLCYACPTQKTPTHCRCILFRPV